MKLTNALRNLLIGLSLAAGAVLPASATQITLSSIGFTPGSGYGVGTNNANTLLDATFSTFAAPATFNLAPGGFFTFNFGTVTLAEDCINGPQDVTCPGSGNETDSLNVTANFQFSSPMNATVQNIAVSGAYVGAVNDPGVDFYINFAPVTVNFGNGGVMTVDLSDLAFSGKTSLTTEATIRLVSDSALVPASVPEPGSVALLGLGMLGLVAARRRKQ